MNFSLITLLPIFLLLALVLVFVFRKALIQHIRSVGLKQRAYWLLSTIAFLWGTYFLWYLLNQSEWVPALQWPFLRGWSYDLLMFGCIAILLAALFLAKRLMVMTAGGYFIGLIGAIFFQTERFDPNRGVIVNNAPTLWAMIFIVFIIIGIVWEVTRFIRKIRKSS